MRSAQARFCAVIALAAIAAPALAEERGEVTVTCSRWDYPKIKCRATWTSWRPEWTVKVDGYPGVVDFETGNTVFLTLPADGRWATVEATNREVTLARFRARWNRAKWRPEFVRTDSER